MSINLQYNYAKINLTTGICTGCMTMSYVIDNPAFIEVPSSSSDYVGKYYNFDTDLWYIDAAMTIEADDVNAMYHG